MVNVPPARSSSLSLPSRARPASRAISRSMSANDMRSAWWSTGTTRRSEEHTSELQSQSNLVCRLLLEKKKTAHKPGKPNVDVKWHAHHIPNPSPRSVLCPAPVTEQPSLLRLFGVALDALRVVSTHRT